MNLSAIHKMVAVLAVHGPVVCDIGGYEFVSYSQVADIGSCLPTVVCDIGGYEFVSYSQGRGPPSAGLRGCL